MEGRKRREREKEREKEKEKEKEKEREKEKENEKEEMQPIDWMRECEGRGERARVCGLRKRERSNGRVESQIWRNFVTLKRRRGEGEGVDVS